MYCEFFSYHYYNWEKSSTFYPLIVSRSLCWFFSILEDVIKFYYPVLNLCMGPLAWHQREMIKHFVFFGVLCPRCVTLIIARIILRSGLALWYWRDVLKFIWRFSFSRRSKGDLTLDFQCVHAIKVFFITDHSILDKYNFSKKLETSLRFVLSVICLFNLLNARWRNRGVYVDVIVSNTHNRELWYVN